MLIWSTLTSKYCKTEVRESQWLRYWFGKDCHHTNLNQRHNKCYTTQRKIQKKIGFYLLRKFPSSLRKKDQIKIKQNSILLNLRCVIQFMFLLFKSLKFLAKFWHSFRHFHIFFTENIPAPNMSGIWELLRKVKIN